MPALLILPPLVCYGPALTGNARLSRLHGYLRSRARSPLVWRPAAALPAPARRPGLPWPAHRVQVAQCPRCQDTKRVTWWYNPRFFHPCPVCAPPPAPE